MIGHNDFCMEGPTRMLCKQHIYSALCSRYRIVNYHSRAAAVIVFFLTVLYSVALNQSLCKSCHKCCRLAHVLCAVLGLENIAAIFIDVSSGILSKKSSHRRDAQLLSNGGCSRTASYAVTSGIKARARKEQIGACFFYEFYYLRNYFRSLLRYSIITADYSLYNLIIRSEICLKSKARTYSTIAHRYANAGGIFTAHTGVKLIDIMYDLILCH